MSRDLGALGERQAAAYLSARGYVVLSQNYTCKGGELDLVCQDPAGTLVFVEVRARADTRHGAPEETVSPLKQRRLIRAARHYLARHGGEDRPCRFDLVAIVGGRVRHLADAFQQGW